jgi:hypothetical protein
MPCHTAPAYLPELRPSSSVAILSMVEATVQRLATMTPSLTAVGLLATTGTLAAGLYVDELRASGIRPEVPAPVVQEHSVMRALRLAKGRQASARLASVCLVSPKRPLLERARKLNLDIVCFYTLEELRKLAADVSHQRTTGRKKPAGRPQCRR